MLNEAGVEHRILNAEEEEGAEYASRYHIKTAPTLFVPNGEDYDVIGNVSGIKGYVNSLAPVH